MHFPDDIEFSDLTARFPHDPNSGRIGLELFPSVLRDQLVPRRRTLRGLPYIDALPGNDSWPASEIASLAQVKLVGDAYPGAFAQGHTLRASPSSNAFRSDARCTERAGERTTVVTTLRNGRGHRLEHRFSWHEGEAAAEITTTFCNDSPGPVTLEMLASFSLGGITPFHEADAPNRLRVHRFRSGWSAEGRLETRTIEEIHLERSWSGAAAFSERFGQVGTMPVRRWFPFVAVEDMVAGVCWGAQLAWAGSWQLEIFRQHDEVCLSGGLADREFGHWTRTLSPGESLTSPTAFVSCVQGSLDDLCDRLIAPQERAADAQPAIEHDLPIVFNEWCTTWGDPQHNKIVAIADRLRGTDARYLVIDAGWYKRADSDWSSGHGDWVPSAQLFPDGLAATARAIRERGLIPGLWYEMETVGSQSEAFTAHSEQMGQRDGLPVTVRERRFWNLNDPRAVAFLHERVTGLLEEAGFGYLKVDYNETVGLGFDHLDGLGEGLRQQVLGSYRFFRDIRARLPELVIENCASGGHRLEPSMLGLTAMSSFSDAHELVEIPIIAANLHRLMLPRQSQIWAVLHRSDSLRRLAYSLAATFLGRMCLSGEITDLNEEQWQLVVRAMRLYRRVAPIIKHGVSRRYGDLGPSWRYPEGWQAVVRTARDGRRALVVVHTFGNSPGRLDVPLPGVGWTVEDRFPSPVMELSDAKLVWIEPGDYGTCVLTLRRNQK